jgi:hypothetical protein
MILCETRPPFYIVYILMDSDPNWKACHQQIWLATNIKFAGVISMVAHTSDICLMWRSAYVDHQEFVLSWIEEKSKFYGLFISRRNHNPYENGNNWTRATQGMTYMPLIGTLSVIVWTTRFREKWNMVKIDDPQWGTKKSDQSTGDRQIIDGSQIEDGCHVGWAVTERNLPPVALNEPPKYQTSRPRRWSEN